MARSFDSLPTENRLRVVELLAADDIPSLHAFSLASKSCCGLATLQRFYHIHIHLASEKRLLIDIEHWEQVLERYKPYPFVRRLSVCGNVYGTGGNDPEDMNDPTRPHPYHRSFPEDEEWTDLASRYWKHVNPPVHLGQTRQWMSLVEFTRKLSQLRDLHWAAMLQLPQYLLQVLHEDLPRCRLRLIDSSPNHLYSRSSWMPPVPAGYASYQHTLATSPSLDSHAVGFGQPFGVDIARYTDRALMHIAAGAAPNLTRLDVQYLMHQHNPYNPTAEAPSYGDLFTTPNDAVSRIQSLGLSWLPLECIERWSECISFSKLKSLQLRVDRGGILRSLAGYRFLSLECLLLHLHSSGSYMAPKDISATLDGEAASFLTSLPPLKRLLLMCSVAEESLPAALAHHGPSLRTFGLIYCKLTHRSRRLCPMAPADIKDIRTQCPRLRHLTLRIPRTQGNKRELDIYAALGRFKSFNSLNLELDCGPLGRDLKAVLSNIAIDESLVREIVARIAGSSSASLLESLRIRARLATICSDVWIFHEVIRETIWEVFRRPDGIIVREKAGNQQISWRKEALATSDVPFEKEFRELWPSKGGHWLYDWHSFPLKRK